MSEPSKVYILNTGLIAPKTLGVYANVEDALKDAPQGGQWLQGTVHRDPESQAAGIFGWWGNDVAMITGFEVREVPRNG